MQVPPRNHASRVATLNVLEAAGLLGVTSMAVNRLIQSGDLVAFTVGHGFCIYRYQVDEYLEANQRLKPQGSRPQR